MSLNKAALKDAIVALLTAEQDEEESATDSINRIAQGMADAMDAFVKSGTVSVNVSTTGTATSHTGTGTGSVT